MLKKMLPALMLAFVISSGYAQVHIGAYYSTFNLPAPNFKANGFGVIAQLDRDESSAYSISLSYFSKRNGVDSVGYIPTDSLNTVYIRYNDKFSFITLSCDYLLYITGGTRPEDRLAAYVGFGLQLLHKVQTTTYEVSPKMSDKDGQMNLGFDFLLGGGIKLGFAELFARGKATILLKHPIDLGTDNNALPLLTNTQVGLLVPLIRNE